LQPAVPQTANSVPEFSAPLVTPTKTSAVATTVEPRRVATVSTAETTPPEAVDTSSLAEVSSDIRPEPVVMDRAALSDASTMLADATRATADHRAAQPVNTPNPDTLAARTPDVVLQTVELRLFRAGLDDGPDAAPADLVALNDFSVLSSDGGSAGVEAAISLVAGGHRRADVLPQNGSSVASVATLLGDGNAEAPASKTADARLNDLLLNPLSISPIARTQTAPTADQPAGAATGQAEEPRSLGERLRPLLLVPLLGWAGVEARRLLRTRYQMLWRPGSRQ
jgi:hypothetical protein